MNLATVLGYLGATGLFALFVGIMINKSKWAIAPVVGGAILALLLTTTFPQLPSATQNGLNGVVNAIINSK